MRSFFAASPVSVLDISPLSLPLTFSQEEEAEVDCALWVDGCRRALYGSVFQSCTSPPFCTSCHHALNPIISTVTWLRKNHFQRQLRVPRK